MESRTSKSQGLATKFREGKSGNPDIPMIFVSNPIMNMENISATVNTTKLSLLGNSTLSDGSLICASTGGVVSMAVSPGDPLVEDMAASGSGPIRVSAWLESLVMVVSEVMLCEVVVVMTAC